MYKINWHSDQLDGELKVRKRKGRYRKCRILAFMLDLLNPNLHISKNSGWFIHLRKLLVYNLQVPIFVL